MFFRSQKLQFYSKNGYHFLIDIYEVDKNSFQQIDMSKIQMFYLIMNVIIGGITNYNFILQTS